MTSQRLWNLATVLAIFLAGYLLLTSWFQPPPQTQLDLFQVNLTLQASRTLDHPEYQPWAGSLLGSNPLAAAQSRYQEVIRQSQRRPGGDPQVVSGLQIRLGLILVQAGEVEQALQIWQQVQGEGEQRLGRILAGLWGNPIRLLPDAEEVITRQLDGWFEGVALQRLLSLQQRGDALNALNQFQDQAALQALARLGIAAGFPIIGSLLGIVVGSLWVIWRVWKHLPWWGKSWSLPWSAQEVQRLLTVWFLGFLLAGQVIPVLYQKAIGIPASQWTSWQQAVALALTYNGAVLVGGILIYRLGRRYYPLAREAWRWRIADNWPIWGVGGYLVALPLVVVASLLSQLLFSGSGGGNPILPLILTSQGWGPRLLFWAVVALCAPIFEELLFRGLVLTTWSQNRPMWQAVVGSGLLFAVAHLNLADVLPLTMLGIILGTVYSHSRNLLAPILLHSLWNTGSFIALLVLGGQ
ncbi:MAG: type II CAAX endopeptidase family protein [Thermostichales cyanobacterium SZTDM-1c_bins_54]